MGILYGYQNGNISTELHENGIKTHRVNGDTYHPAFAEHYEVKISDKCDGACLYCCDDCSPNGHHADLQQPWVDTLHPYTSVSIHGNDLSHPQLTAFLVKLQNKNILTELIVDQMHFEKQIDLLRAFRDRHLMLRIGVSLRKPTLKLIELLREFPNSYLRVIVGIFDGRSMRALEGFGLEAFVSGYRTTGRGGAYAQTDLDGIFLRTKWLRENFYKLFDTFDKVSLDPLATNQLDIRRQLDEESLKRLSVDENNLLSCYIDMVEKTFSANPFSDIRYPILDSVDAMFEKIK